MFQRFKLLYLYLFIFTIISTYVMWYSIDSTRMTEKRCMECKCEDEQNREKENFTSTSSPLLLDDVRAISISLKNKLFYRNDVVNKDFNRKVDFEFASRALSIADEKDHGLLKLLFPILRNHSRFHFDRIERQLVLTPKLADKKVVLVYYFNNILTANSLRQDQCEIDSCVITTDKNQVNKADAVVFRRVPVGLRRPQSRPYQIWISHQLESPENVRKLSLNSEERVNWTATFRSDSVLVTPYGKFVTFKNISKFPEKPPRNFAKGKSKLAAWFVSNCGGMNGRMKYVRQLQRFVKIDIYGFCGYLKCKRGFKCMEMLKHEYKFYLAFENSNCRDYITEKFYNALQHDVIPIVMGAHPEDYKRVAPPNSFIHVDEFDSPRQLAEYMHILNNNDDLYNEYFHWKDTGIFINTKFACRLCAMLQIAPIFPMWHADVNDWWYKNQCVRPNLKAGQKWSTWKKILS